MAGFLETFVRYVDELGSNPVDDTAARVRADAKHGSRQERADAEALASDIERINRVLGGGR